MILNAIRGRHNNCSRRTPGSMWDNGSPGRIRQRQGKIEEGAFPGNAVDANRSALAFYELSRYIEPQTKPGIGIHLTVMNTKELLKYFLLHFFGNADPEVFYAHHDLIVIRRRTA